MHIDLFCPLEQYPRGTLEYFVHWKGSLRGISCHVLSTGATPKNTFNMFNSTRLASEGELCVCLLLERHPSGHFTRLKGILSGHVTKLSPMEGHPSELFAKFGPLQGTVLCHWIGS